MTDDFVPKEGNQKGNGQVKPYHDLKMTERTKFSKAYANTNYFTRFIYNYAFETVDAANSRKDGSLKDEDVQDMNLSGTDAETFRDIERLKNYIREQE